MESIKFVAILLIFTAAFPIVLAHERNFTEATELIDSGASCEQLTDEQLESIGDYYMEQMHPGEAHEIMDERMGGEGSETLKQMHISIARSFYCGEYWMMSAGMMNTLMGRNLQNRWGNMMWG